MGGEYLQVSLLAESLGASFCGTFNEAGRYHNALGLGHGTQYPPVIKTGGIALYIRC